MESFWKWSVEEMAAWAKTRDFARVIKPRLDKALPRGGALHCADPSTLGGILDSAGRAENDLARLFAASALLEGASQDLWQLLQTALQDVPLADWRHGKWRLATVPCMGETATMVSLMCGHAAHKLPGAELGRLSSESREAIRLASSLAARRWPGHFTCWHWSERDTISGASLGLPVFLAFGCAANDMPAPQALATGKLDTTGAIEAVENVENKASLAGDRSFLVPEANYSHTLPVGCIPVGHVDDAWDIWKNCEAGKSPEYLRTLLHGLDKTERLFPFLMNCTEAELGFLGTPERVTRIQAACKGSPSAIAGLRPLLIEIATSKAPNHRKARELILEIFPATELHPLAERAPALAWRLAMLHIRALNHSGHPEEASKLREAARQWEEDLEFSDSEEELISCSLAVVGTLHNTYRFGEDAKDALGPSLVRQLAAMERNHAGGDRKRNKPLGDWYGTLAQQHAFRGEFVEAENYLGRAIECFDGQPEEQRQSLSYRFFARLDAGKPEALDDLLGLLGIEGLEPDWSSHIQRIENPYRRAWALFALARYAADVKDAPSSMRAQLAHAADVLAHRGRVWGMTPDKHPWQLVLLNLGLIADEDGVRQKLWQKSLELCLHVASGPTINVMALLPLAAMKAHGLELPADTEETVAGLIDTIRHALDTEHFSAVISASGWPEVLDIVSKGKRTLFPFNYR